VTGTAFYARPGLVHEDGLDRFWQAPVEPNRASFSRFHRYMMHTTQINASFYALDGLVPPGLVRAAIGVAVKLAGSATAMFVFGSGGASTTVEMIAQGISDALAVIL
jgi:capsular polysaccharide export protein